MNRALILAQKAALENEVPVGAVVVYQDKVVGRGYNQVESKKGSSFHAELTALRQAAKKLKRWRLAGCTLYVTLEPCTMCAGAIILSRIDRLVYATADPKAGACGSVLNVLGEKRLNHRVTVDFGIKQAESSHLLKDFFRQNRQKIKKSTI
jgi:tRNA(adenine34) deaminase